MQTDPHSARLDDQSGADDEPARPIDWCSFKTHDNHDFLSDTSTVWNGSRSVWIGRAENAAREPYFSVDALWQSVDATPYRGTRIELSAHVKGRGYFQLFLRAARSADRAIVLTHNQSPNVPTTNRYVSLFPPNGDDWTRLSIVGEIPAGVDVIYYGVSLMNGNAIWIDDVRLSPAEPQMPLTNVQSHGGHVELPVHVTAMLSAPSNLDFEVATGSASPRDSACRVSLGRSE